MLKIQVMAICVLKPVNITELCSVYISLLILLHLSFQALV